MSVKRLPNGRYKARVRLPDGREISRTCDLKRDADEWADAQRTDMRRGTWVDPRLGRQTFLAFADEWAAVQDGWKQGTRDVWPFVRARLEPDLGGLPLAAVDQLALKRLRAKLADRYATETVRHTMTYAGMILRAAYVSRRIGHDPTAGLRERRRRADDTGRVGPDQIPSRAEAQAILAAAPDRFRAAIALGFAGLRVGEVLAMTADRVDLAHRRVTVDRQVQRYAGRLQLTTPKAEKVRIITVPGFVAVDLRRHLRDHQGDGVLFRPARGAPLMRRDSFYVTGWRLALVAAGLDERRYRFHACRHWCASTLLADGAPLSAVAAHLGDTVQTVSQIYVHWLRDEPDVPAAVLDRAMAPENPAASTRPGGS